MRHPEGGSIGGIWLLGGVVGLRPERVSSTVAAEAAVNVNKFEVDSGPPLSSTGGGTLVRLMLGWQPRPLLRWLPHPIMPGGDPGRPCRDGVPGCCWDMNPSRWWGSTPDRCCWDGAPGRCWGGGGWGVPSAICLSEPLLAVAEVDPLFVAETASSAHLRGPAPPPPQHFEPTE